MKKGLEQEIKQVLEKGKLKGQLLTNRENARKMLTLGLSFENISAITELTAEEIESLE